MARYIDADALLRVAPFTKRGGDLTEYTEGYLDCAEDARNAIERAATADVEEVVRCKDCIHFVMNEQESLYICAAMKSLRLVQKDHYCSFGQRKENDDTQINNPC